MNNMTLEQAIEHAKEVAASKCDECGKEHQQLAEWLAELLVSREKIKRLEIELKADHQQAIDTANELAAYKDKTYISDEWLEKNGFERQNYDTFLYCNDSVEISARIVDTEVGIWKVFITFLDHGDIEELDICTLGQFRMFLAIEGLKVLKNNLNHKL